jgi:hypothetical protein
MNSEIEDLLDIGNLNFPIFYPNTKILNITNKSNITAKIDNPTSYMINLNKKDKIKIVHDINIDFDKF